MHGLTLTSDPPPAPTGRTVELDGRECRTAAAFFTAAQRALALPDWFGHNWDAFEESVADLDPPLVELRVTHADALLADDPPRALHTLVAIVDDAPPTLVLVSATETLDGLRARLEP